METDGHWSCHHAQSDDGTKTWIKATWLAPHLIGHESEILTVLHGVKGVPKFSGTVLLGGPNRAHRTRTVTRRGGPRGGEHLELTAHLLEGKFGRRIEASDSEDVLASSASQVCNFLAACAERDVHYRDLSFGSILSQQEGSLVIVDFGTARVGSSPARSRDGPWRRQGDGRRQECELCGLDSVKDVCDGAVQYGLAPSFELGEKFLATVTVSSDDVKSANPMFASPCHKAVTRALDRWANASRALEAIEAKASEGCTGWLNSHRYIDDAESLLWMLLDWGNRRSVPTPEPVRISCMPSRIPS